MTGQKDAVTSDRAGIASLAIVIAVLALSLGDALIKLASSNFSFWQIYVLRSMIALPLLAGIILIGFRGRRLWPRSLFWTFVRSLLMALNWIFFYAALPYVALSVAAAAYYTSPLFITLFAGLFVGERVRAIQWVAVVIGFLGVLIMLRPDATGINGYALLPIVAAVLYALTGIVTRTKCSDEEPLMLSVALNFMFLAVGCVASLALFVSQPSSGLIETYPFLLGPWAALEPREWLIIGSLAVIIVIGSIGAAFAYQNGPPQVIATFDYSYLAFATLWGALIFHEVPDGVTATGMVMIVAAGMLVMRR